MLQCRSLTLRFLFDSDRLASRVEALLDNVGLANGVNELSKVLHLPLFESICRLPKSNSPNRSHLHLSSLDLIGRRRHSANFLLVALLILTFLDSVKCLLLQKCDTSFFF